MRQSIGPMPQKQNKKLRVLYQNRPKHHWLGGDMIQLEKTMDAVKDKIDGTFNDQPLFTPALLLQMYDIVHLWNFSMEWTKYQIWAASRHKRKIVVSMIYHDTEAFIPYANQQIMADACDALIFLSKGEVVRARKHLTIPDEKIHIIPNGIDSFWLTKKAKKTKGEGYVLTVGRIDGTKGQYETALACNQLGFKYVCVGEILDEEYARQCRIAGAELVGKKTHEELIPIYDNALMFVLASSTELFPLSVMEAGARGLNSVVTDTCEWKDIPNVEWCKWQDTDSIKDAISRTFTKESNKEFQKKLKTMTWKSVGNQVLQVYKKITK